MQMNLHESPGRGMAAAVAAVLSGVLATLTPAGIALGQEAAVGPVAAPATSPATPPAARGEALIATITAIKGVVQVRTAEDQPWKAAAVGMELDEGAEFRTGPRSAVQFVIPPDQTITL